ncbi:MAG TPA: hypothetical protein VHB21_17575, partial [Minicystis sp.]|nr:hypothetical protein [Minicystis sp.]
APAPGRALAPARAPAMPTATATATIEPAHAAPSPAARDEPFAPLAVPGFLDAVVSLPSDAGRRPLVVATHGAGGTPEWWCARVRALVDASAFVLCPRGRAMSRFDRGASGFYYPDHHALARELAASLAALAARYGERVDVEAPLYAGFSQGATMGSLALPGFRFRALLLVEGGYDTWTVALARAFHASGGARVLLACGRPSCSRPARASLVYLRRGGVEARLVGGDGAGHTFGGAVETGVVDALPFWLGADRRLRAGR